MPVILIVILSILLLITLLLFLPVSIKIEYTDSLKIQIRYLFLSFRFPKDKKKLEEKAVENAVKVSEEIAQTANEEISQKSAKKKKKSNFEKAKPENVFVRAFKQKGLSGLIELIKELTVFFSKEIKKLFLRIIVKELSVNVSVSGSDAADAAMNYGYACMVIYPAISLIEQNLNVKSVSTNLSPNFEEGAKTKIYCCAKLRFKLFWGIRTAISAFFGAGKILNS